MAVVDATSCASSDVVCEANQRRWNPPSRSYDPDVGVQVPVHGVFLGEMRNFSFARRSESGKRRRLGSRLCQSTAVAQELLLNATKDGPATLWKCAVTDSCKKSKTDIPLWVQVAIVVQMRSSQRWPASLREPWVMRRSITTNRMACSAKLFVGSIPGIVTNRR